MRFKPEWFIKMNDIINSAKKIRKAMSIQYSIDHVIELRLIAAVLLENEIGDPYEEYDLYAAAKFAKYFNMSWNLETGTKKENNQKKEAVLKFIQWKYDPDGVSPDEDVLETISYIYSFYCENRYHVFDAIQNDEPGHRRRFREVERSLYMLLKCSHCPHPFINFDDIKLESSELYNCLQTHYSLDHIVELQIISVVLAKNNVKKIHIAANFAGYFNEDWNFQIMTRERNERKGVNVQIWLDWVNSGRDNILENFIFNTIKFISVTYQRNRFNVINNIRNDNSINGNIRNWFFNIENDLYNFLKIKQ